VDIPVFRGVLEHLALEARDAGRQDVFNRIVDALGESAPITKTLLLDIYLKAPGVTESEAERLRRLCREDRRMIDYLLEFALCSANSPNFPLICGLLREVSQDEETPYEINRRIAESLPNLIEIDAGLARGIMQSLRVRYYRDRWKADIRRRILEAAPFLWDKDQRATEDLLLLRDKDEIYTVIALVEAIAELQIGNRIDSAARDQLIARLTEGIQRQARVGTADGEMGAEDAIHLVNFLSELLRKLDTSPQTAIDDARQLCNTDSLHEKICVARNVPKVLDRFPEEVLSIMNRFADENEHYNVRRPVAMALPRFLSIRGLEQYAEFFPRIDGLILKLSSDRDELIRRAVSDVLPLLAPVSPETTLSALERLVGDEDAYVHDRSRIMLLKLMTFFPDRKEHIANLVKRHS
jgi:hypothetical protein